MRTAVPTTGSLAFGELARLAIKLESPAPLTRLSVASG